MIEAQLEGVEQNLNVKKNNHQVKGASAGLLYFFHRAVICVRLEAMYPNQNMFKDRHCLF